MLIVGNHYLFSVYESEDKSLSIGLYPLNDGLAAVEYLKN